MKFRNLELDKFQEESIGYIEKGYSVVVSAATGTGKTLIADYVIDKYLKEGKRIFYTAPIKALSNQKFSDFKKLYGIENVGILTGDVSYNSSAPIIIMTTEIYRNMLLAKDKIVDDLAYVVFDEIHYLGDEERGTVWEECLIFSHENTRFLCLSATIPNARQLANWIEHIKKHPVKVVVEKKRAVPLEHLFFDNQFGVSTVEEVEKRMKHDRQHFYRDAFKKKFKVKRMGHIDLIKSLKEEGKIPCIYFCFSRDKTETKAEDTSKRFNFLSSEQSLRTTQIAREKLQNLSPEIRNLKTTRILRECLSKGVAFHHAGLLPALKELVEELFSENLIYVLYATETFAVGINMPAKTVCFDSLEKYDGVNFRYLYSKEYFQLAGRAGRRGIDTVGYAISTIDREFSDIQKIKTITADDKDQLKSQYKLSYNTILNLISNHSKEEREVILKSSFYSYQKTGLKDASQILSSFNFRKKKLESMDYIKDDSLTDKGRFAQRIYSHELQITEIFATKLKDRFDDFEVMLIAAALEFEPKRSTRFEKGKKEKTRHIIEKLAPNKSVQSYFSRTDMHLIEPMLKAWFDLSGFSDITSMTTMPEGDIVRFIRRIIDVLQQIANATEDIDLRERIRQIIARIDRDVIKVNL